MASKQALSRLRKELKAISADPPPNIHVYCDESNILAWSYLLEGPEDTPYEGGFYWGRLKFPKDYPFAPPSILMVTPNGRFETNVRLCLSMSDYHPESWQPAWSLATVLKGLLSFMCEETPTAGAVNPPPAVEVRRRLAEESLAWNKAQAEFMRDFPEFDAIVAAALEKKQLQSREGNATDSPPTPAGYPVTEAAPGFAPGDTVRIRGLKARADLNGREGKVQEPGGGAASVGRIHVCVAESDEIVGVKPENLESLRGAEHIAFEKVDEESRTPAAADVSPTQ